jgi:16S rRNA (adenine1518-N6/adenine1519-N6)-dimethyltransferase
MRPHKEFSQNFIVNHGVLEKMANLISDAGNAVIEIGAGPAVLTRLIAEQTNPTLAWEIDRRFKEFHPLVGLPEHVQFFYEDFLTADLSSVLDKNHDWVIAGNLPYAITGLLFRKLLDPALPVNHLYFLIQEEVARRMVMVEGREYGLASVIGWLYGSSRICFTVKPGSFYPVPKVRSSFIEFTRQERGISATEREELLPFLKAAFAGRRKTLVNSLKMRYIEDEQRDLIQTALRDLGHDVRVRAENLHPEQLLAIFRKIRYEK